VDREGHVHSDRLGRGWCWRIPLRGRVSVGAVVPRETLSGAGESAEAQLEAVRRGEPLLAAWLRDARRLTPVVRYSNYQLSTLRGVGPGWALVGDSFGFVDPVFSSGLFLALEGARALAGAIAAGSASALRRYERGQRRHIAAWQRAVGYFYDGRFFALFRLDANPDPGWFGRTIGRHLAKHVARVFTGEGTRGGYSPRVLKLAAERVVDPAELPGLRVG
jgi:2-polyprenyl-6-methoxyphenol hydroxylase-like FAD-dependent oxidoreductase